MNPVAVLVGRLGRASRLINPLQRLDRRLLRSHPLLWRTQVLVVTSYALVVAGVLHILGRRQRFATIATVPTSEFLTWVGLISLLVTLLALGPWLYRNLQTRYEGRSIGLLGLFMAYLCCFYSLSLVSTAYLFGTLRALSDYPLAAETIAADNARFGDFMTTNEFYKRSYYDDTTYADSPVIYDTRGTISYADADAGLETFTRLRAIFSHYRVAVCAEPFDATGYIGTFPPPAKGRTCLAPEAERLIRRIGVNTREMISERQKQRVKLRSDSSAESLESAAEIDEKMSLRFTVAVDLRDGRIAASLTELRSKLRALEVAKLEGDYYRPLTPLRLAIVFSLALAATIASYRDLLPPPGLRAISGLRRWYGERMTVLSYSLEREAQRLRQAPAMSLALRGVTPFYARALIWLVPGAIVVAVAIPRSSAAEVISLLLLSAAFALRACMTTARGYSVYESHDLAEHYARFYRPLLVLFSVSATFVAATSAADAPSGFVLLQVGELFFAGLWLITFLEGLWCRKQLGALDQRRARMNGTLTALTAVFMIGFCVVLSIVFFAYITLTEKSRMNGSLMAVLLPLALASLVLAGLSRLSARAVRSLATKLVFDVAICSVVAALVALCLYVASPLAKAVWGAEGYEASERHSNILAGLSIAIVVPLWFRLADRFTTRPFFARLARALQTPRDG